MIPGSLNDRPLLHAVKAEITHLEEKGDSSRESGHAQQSVIYYVAAMRLRVMLQQLGFADPSHELFEHTDQVGQLEKLLANASH